MGPRDFTGIVLVDPRTRTFLPCGALVLHLARRDDVGPRKRLKDMEPEVISE